MTRAFALCWVTVGVLAASAAAAGDGGPDTIEIRGFDVEYANVGLFGALIAVVIGLGGLMARSFGWL